MAQLAFIEDDRLFDGECVRFAGLDGEERVLCGVTTAALKIRDPEMQHYGLVPAETFLAAFDKYMIEIHAAARAKYERQEFETESPIRIMVHRADLCP
jgi:hypothetical protein